LKKNWAGMSLVILVALYTVTFSYLSIRRHAAFASSYDLANMDQTVWNTIHGNFFSLSGSVDIVSRLGLHADLILVLLSPFYLIYDHVAILLVLQSFFIALAAVPAYLLARDVLKSKLKGLIIAVVYLLNPGVQWTNIYDFHGVALAMFFLLAAFYGTYRKKWKWVYLFALLAMLTKESVSLAIVMLGIYTFVFVKERGRGLILTCAGMAWFLLTIFFLIPHFAEFGRYWVWDWFKLSDYSASSGEGINMQLIFERVVGAEAIGYYISLLKPFGFLPLIGLPWLFISAPDILINLMSKQGQMRSIVFHYDSIAMVGLVMATIFGWKYIEMGLKKYKFVGWIVGVLLIAAAVRTNYHYSPLPTTPSYWRPMYEVGQDEIAFEKALKEIPLESSITASSEVRPHLTHRKYAFNLPNMIDNVDYIAMVDQNRIVGDYNPKEFETQLIEKLSVDEDFELIFHQGHFYLFKRMRMKVGDNNPIQKSSLKNINM